MTLFFFSSNRLQVWSNSFTSAFNLTEVQYVHISKLVFKYFRKGRKNTFTFAAYLILWNSVQLKKKHLRLSGIQIFDIVWLITTRHRLNLNDKRSIGNNSVLNIRSSSFDQYSHRFSTKCLFPSIAKCFIKVWYFKFKKK